MEQNKKIKLPVQEHPQTIRDTLAIFFIKKNLFVGTFLSVVLSALLVSLFYPPIYEVSAEIIVKPNIETPMLFDKQVSRVDYDNRVNTQMLNTVIQLIGSPTVMRQVVIKNALANDDTEAAIKERSNSLSQAFKAESLSLSNIIKLNLRGADPHQLVDILNSIIDEYINYHINVNQTSKGSFEFFNRQADAFQTRLTNTTIELADESERVRVSDPLLQKESMLKLIKDFEIKLADFISQRSELKEQLLLLRKAEKNIRINNRWFGLPKNIMESFPGLVEMSKAMAQLIINKQKAMSNYLPNSKEVFDAQSQYDNMHKHIKQQLVRVMDELKTKLASRNDDIKQVNINIEQAQQKLAKLTSDSIKLERLQLEYKLIKNNYVLYNSKREEARINLAKDKELFANIAIATRPSVPQAPWFPNKIKIMIMAIILALFLSLGLCVAVYALDQRIFTPNDIISHTKIRYLGSLDNMSS